MNRVVCQNCGARVDLPEGFSRAKIRCPGCGYYAEVPSDQRAAAERSSDVQAESVADDVLNEPDLTESPPTQADTPRRAEPAARQPKTAARAAKAPPKAAPKAKPSADPRDSRPNFETDEPSGKPLLEGDQDVDEEAYGDDVTPYGVPGTGTKPCPHCRGQLPLSATLCVHCGRDLETGEKTKRRFQLIDKTWEEGWPFAVRLQVFLGLQAINVFAAFIIIATSGSSFRDCAGLFGLVSGNLVQIGLQAFLVGTYDTLSVSRNAKGRATLTRTRRVAFYKLPQEKLPWKKSTNIGIAGADIGCFARALCFYFVFEGGLFVLSGFLNPFMLGLAFVYFGMAVGFYWVVLRPERFEINLCNEHGATDDIVFRSISRDQSEEIAKTIAEATGLHYRSVM